MDISELLTKYAQHPLMCAVADWLDGKSDKSLWMKGMAGSSRAAFFASFFAQHPHSFFFVLDDEESAAYFYHDLVQLLGYERQDDILFLPSSYKRSIRFGEKDASNVVMRNETLNRIQSDAKPALIVSFPQAVAEMVTSSAALQNKTLTLTKGQNIKQSSVTFMLRDFGFERVDFVAEPGQFSVRGSILDVYSFAGEFPFRIDFFGDEIDSIRTFEIDSQLSKDTKERISIVSDVNNAQSAADAVSLLTFLPDSVAFVLNDFAYMADALDDIHKLVEDSIQGELVSMIASEDLRKDIKKFKRIEFGLHAAFRGEKLQFNTAPQILFHKKIDLVVSDFEEKTAEGYEVFVMSDNEHQTERLASIFESQNKKVAFTPILKTVHEGFIDDDLHLCCYTDHQIFDRFHKYSLSSEHTRQSKAALTLKDLQNIQIGDYIVHIDYGIGRFGGLMKMDINGKTQEVIKLIYRDNDLVFINIHSLHKVAKYKPKEGEAPRVSKLGTGAWQTLKDRTKKKVKDIAKDLILLYSQRREEKGFAFSPDSFMQSELESSFIYEDTPDQLKATIDVKHDMEQDRPMDRLVCGDVGFGKTEVAIRAAFKAVADNKQVAVLVPTTVLAFQHYQTFSERLKDFPCRVDYLSRTRSAKDTKAVIEDLKEGKVNIIIGTHKLIGKTIKFKDLGLLIVDEEQKFGVSVKEKIRQMKVNVDTLTLTATPIPRTLQFSLMGARDLSVIKTPPPNRYPVQTQLSTFNDDIIRDAIRYELDRNGQVFFVNNRIDNLGTLKTLINTLVPEARVVVGHGRMAGEDLEKVILDFLNYDYDVLLSTSIIEAGVDISNCNTIIVNDAQNFGLSDLHQLRGRVGRSNRRAFCYLLSPPMSALSEDSRRRLESIESFSNLGSGFNIAMQDLDIRGAGNLLGAEQSGFIADMGYETYYKILNEALTEIKEAERAKSFAEGNNSEDNSDEPVYSQDCQMETDMELLIPSDYVENISERMNLYREIDALSNQNDFNTFCKNLEDRFGKMPEQVANLLELVRLRWIALSLGFSKCVFKNNKITCFFLTDPTYFHSKTFESVLKYVTNHIQRCAFRPDNAKPSAVFNDVRSIQEARQIFTAIYGGECTSAPKTDFI